MCKTCMYVTNRAYGLRWVGLGWVGLGLHLDVYEGHMHAGMTIGMRSGMHDHTTCRMHTYERTHAVHASHKPHMRGVKESVRKLRLRKSDKNTDGKSERYMARHMGRVRASARANPPSDTRRTSTFVCILCVRLHLSVCLCVRLYPSLHAGHS